MSLADPAEKLTLTDGERVALQAFTDFLPLGAIIGRRSRRFPVGGSLSAGQLASVDAAFGRIPGTVPAVQILNCPQAQHIDSGFSDHHPTPDSYLDTYGVHQEVWHS